MIANEPTNADAVAARRAEAKLEQVRKAFHTYIRHAITVRDMNSAEWMKWFAERTNEACAAVGEPDRVEPGAGLLRIVRARK